MRFGVSLFFLLSSRALWAAGPAQGGGWVTFVPLVAILGIFYFLLIRPQQKQAREHQRMVNELKRGDRILTQGGIYGTVQTVKGKVLEVKISEETKVLIAKGFVTEVLRGDPTVETDVVEASAAKA